ncbi:MAG: hypothetical protein Q9188_004911 [Gyalolechia gomerana]
MLNYSAHGFKRIRTNPDAGAKADNDKPRAAPARPKALDFPQYQNQGDLNAARGYAQDFDRLFVDLEKSVSPTIIEAFNISLVGNVPLDQLVPSEYLPLKEWLQDPSTVPKAPATDRGPKKLSNGIPVPSHRDFYARAKELLYSTDDAFDSVSGTQNTGRSSTQPPPRLSHTHKFFQNLHLVADYWDTSKDNYMTTTTTPTTESSNSNNENNTEETYTGRRQGAPHQMHPIHREDTISAFLELAIWPHRCTLQSSSCSLTRKLLFQQRRYLPIQHISTAVCRSITTDRKKARSGILEGPLMGVHCRNTTTFRKEGENLGEGREELMDLLHEVGAALLVAQKRVREGKTEELIWKGKFWAEGRKRHLGEVGGGKQDRESDKRAKREIYDGVDAMEGVEMTTTEEKGEIMRKKKQRCKAQSYLDAKPPESMWEAKVEYRMVGKEVGKGFDTIFLISALNHHISILSIRIHDRYLDFFTNGITERDAKDDIPGEQNNGDQWWRLELKRSKWFDLFNARDRAEALRGVWGVTGWLMREV